MKKSAVSCWLLAVSVAMAAGMALAELPAGYTAVEWIESSGGAYIDTGHHPTRKTRIVADFNPLETESWGSFFGLTADDHSSNGILMRYYDAEDKLNGWFCNENYHEAQIGGVANKRIQVELKEGGMTVGGSSAKITTTGTPYDGSIYIFSVNHNGEPYRSHAMRLYAFTIYGTVGDGSERKVRDFVPCVRKSDQAVGLYDLAESDPSKGFYANAGSGAFGGPDGVFCTVTVGALKNMTAAYTFGDGSVTNDVEGTTFEVLPGTKNLTVVFTAADGCRFADDSTVKTVTRDEATGDLDLTAETPVAHRVQPTATITKITNRYPWNGKIDVEYELSYLELAFSPIDAIVTKFTSGDIEVTKTNDLSDAELAARTARRTFDCRELFGEGKRDAEAQSSATLVMPDYAVIDISRGASVNSYPVTYHKSAPASGWNTDEYKTSKIVLYYVKAGTYKGNQCKDQTTMGFWIGVFPVTEAQYANVMGGSGSTTQPKTIVSYTTLRGTDNSSATVAGESFLKRLCDRTGLNGFDLPTESQWEIACRAGTTSDNYWGDDQSDKYMWNSGNSGSLQEVGQKLPNAWGLYDMMGNVWEWCRDGYHTSFTVDLSADVCIEPSAGYYQDYRFLRGCSFSSSMFGVKSSARNVDAAGNFNSDWGFRLSRMSSNESAALSVGPSFSFDTRAEKTIAGTETLTYSGDDWGAGGTGVTVWYSLDGGETIELKTATDSGTVSWTPTLNGRYEFGHVVTDGTTETAVLVVNGLPGGEANPWEIGEGVTAYVKDHVLYLKGEGKVDEFADGAPWAGYDDLLTGIGPLSRAITLPASVAATLPISVEGGVLSGAISPAEFEQMQIIDGRAYLGVSVCTNGDVTATTEGWQKAAIEEAQVEEDGTVTLTVPATAERGFMILKSKAAEKKGQ